MGLTACLPAVLVLLSAPAAADRAPGLPTFKADVLPILAENCLMCHGQEPRQGGLDLQSAATLLKGGQSGPAIVAGSPDRSLLMEKLVSGQMPPGEARLSPEGIERIRHWIERGAPREYGLDPGVEDAAYAGLPAVSEKDVLPIFQVRCVACHGKRQQEAGLDLRTRASRLKGGRSGPAVLPGNPDQSPIIQKIESGEMPPVELQLANSVRPATAAELKLLRRWIAAGAPPDPPVSAAEEVNGGPAVTEQDRKFWSFQPPVRPSIPEVRAQELVRTPVDAFLLARLEAGGLSFSPPASPLQLLRRAYLDLVGMPPSAFEVEAYLQDRRPDAYERMIERLLSSSHYGERWGRYWLDLAGYSDSEGFGDHDRFRPYAWRYRDYVIRSFNRDKPYSQFLMEQIAGDELADYRREEVTPESIDRLAATGFLRTTPDPTDAPERGFIAERMNIIADEIEVLTSAVMGLTVKCARCHDHKYDPISQRDYYRLSAILQTSYDPYEWLPPKKRRILIGLEREQEEVAAHNRPLKAEIGSLEKRLLQEAAPFVDKLQEERLAALPEALRRELRKLAHTPQDYEGGELNRKFLVVRELAEDESSEVHRYLAGKFRKRLKIGLADLNDRFPEFAQKSDSLRKQLDEVKGKLRAEPYVRALMDTGGRPSTTFLLKRGDPVSPGEAVTPGVPAVLTAGLTPYRVHPLKPGRDSSGRRLALARWLTQPGHPLTSRVMVNQVWLRHFGRGLVPSPSNFGRSGEAPHPSRAAGLAGHRIRQPGLEHQVPAPDHDDLHRLSPDLADRAGSPGARSRKHPAVSNAEGADGCRSPLRLHPEGDGTLGPHALRTGRAAGNQAQQGGGGQGLQGGLPAQHLHPAAPLRSGIPAGSLRPAADDSQLRGAQELYRGHPGPAHDERFGRVGTLPLHGGQDHRPGGLRPQEPDRSSLSASPVPRADRVGTGAEPGGPGAVRPPMEVPPSRRPGSDPRPLGRPVAGPGQSVSYFVELGRVQLRGLRSLCYTSPLENGTPV